MLLFSCCGNFGSAHTHSDDEEDGHHHGHEDSSDEEYEDGEVRPMGLELNGIPYVMGPNGISVPAQLAAMGAVAIDRLGRYWIPGRGVVMVSRNPVPAPQAAPPAPQVSSCGQFTVPPAPPNVTVGNKRPASETATSGDLETQEGAGGKKTRWS